MKYSSVIKEKIQKLKPSEAIHIGHSYAIINVAGVKIAIDPATDNGYCPLPFSNLIADEPKYSKQLKPLISPERLIPSAEDLARNVDIIIYSHLHSDHFNLFLLSKILDMNPSIKVMVPKGTKKIIFDQNKNKRGVSLLIFRTKFFQKNFEGIFQYLNSKTPIKVAQERICEIDDGLSIVSENKQLEISAFDVRHPRPQFYIRLPFEEKFLPPVLGYKFSYTENSEKRKIIYVAESSTDPAVLWQIWNERNGLVGVFVPVADEKTTKGLKWFKDTYLHASLQIIGLSEILVNPTTSIHCLHQGLWYYTLDPKRVEISRIMTSGNKIYSDSDVSRALAKSKANRHFSIKGFAHQNQAIKVIRNYVGAKYGNTVLTPIGEVFKMGKA